MKISSEEKDKERFQSKIEIDSSGCWNWKGSNWANGTLRFKAQGKDIPARRYSFMISKGEIPSEMIVTQTCKNPKCVNPDHLTLITAQESSLQRSHATKTHCAQGHLLEGDNLYIRAGRDGKTKRSCRICRQASDKKLRG